MFIVARRFITFLNSTKNEKQQNEITCEVHYKKKTLFLMEKMVTSFLIMLTISQTSIDDDDFQLFD